MSREQEIFKRAIGEAYERQVMGRGDAASEDERLWQRGRRRRIGRTLGAAGLTAAVAVGAIVSVDAVGSDRRHKVVSGVPAIGAEKVMESGGPLAGSSEALFVANDDRENDRGDMSSMARLDLETGAVTDTELISISASSNISMGPNGVWIVQWTGSTSGDGHFAHGTIRSVDPDAGEVLLDLPREDSAPYDVAVSVIDDNETAWVVDSARDELLAVDGASGEVRSTKLDSSPQAVAVAEGYVWVTGSSGKDKGTLTRFDPETGAKESFPVDHCLGDLVVSDGSVWTTNACDGEVHRFDATSGEEVATIAVGGFSLTAIAVSDDSIWVSRLHDIVRIDPASNEVVGDPIVAGQWVLYLAVAGGVVFASSLDGVYRLGEGLPIQPPIPIPTPEEEDRSDPLASETCHRDGIMCVPLDREWSIGGAGFGTAWVANVGEGKTFGIARFDAETGEEFSRLPTDGFVQDFAPDDLWMWALLETGDELVLLKIDPATTEVESSYEMGRSGDVGTSSLTVGGGKVWVAGADGAVTVLSADSDDDNGGAITIQYGDQLPGYGPANGPLHLAYGDDRLWLSYGTGHVGVVDPVSNELVHIEEDALGVNAYDIIYAAGQVWSTHQTPYGKNVLSYVSTEGKQASQGQVQLLDAVPIAAASDVESIWVLQEGFGQKDSDWLVRIDPVAHALVGEPLELDLEFRGSLAWGDGYIWVTGDRVLYRVAPD